MKKNDKEKNGFLDYLVFTVVVSGFLYLCYSIMIPPSYADVDIVTNIKK